VPATTVATVKVTNNATLGDILTGGVGRTLYSFAPSCDPASKDPTKCATACLLPRPPFLTAATPTAPPDVTGKFGTVTRTDFNVKQVTYNDMPLYYFVQDTAPGDAKGRDSKGFKGDWQVVKTS
jgi:predicted lipoprotein with Yx(FWY)xxD motif